MAEESIVLLKNNNDTLPLDPNKKQRILVTGPNAASVHLGGYSPKPFLGTSLLQGIRDYTSGLAIDVEYAAGCEITTSGEGSNEIETDTSDTAQFASAETNQQLIKQAVAAAEKCDTIILAIGGNEHTAREAYFAGDSRGDRDDIDLFGDQNALVKALLPLGKPIIAVLIHGRPLSPQLVAAECPAIIDAFYPGEEGGHALASILFGEINPSGKLPVTLVRNVGQIPGFYYQKPSGKFRNYVASDSTPLFSFGHGLSYTRFEIGAPKVNKTKVSAGDKITVTARVKNTGKRAGQEVVQLYIRDEIASRTRPIKQFSLEAEDYGFLDAQGKLRVEPGRLKLMVGSNSEELKELTITLT